MKKYGWIILLVVALVVGGIIYFYNSNSKQNSNYSAERSSLNNVSNTNNDNNTSNTLLNNTTNNTTENTPAITVEQEIATFSTKIQNKRDSNRQGNISITCSALNNTTVAPGEIFSFCDTVGQSTEERGYKEANVIIQGVETKGLGGRKLPS